MGGKALSTLGKGMGPSLIALAKSLGTPLPPELDVPDAKITPELVVPFLHDIDAHLFPRLAADAGDGS